MSRKYYCGPCGAPEWLRRILSYKFNASCKVHDLDYGTHRFSRHDSDMRFFGNMIKQANGSLFWEIVAVIYFMTARICGGKHWEDDE